MRQTGKPKIILLSILLSSIAVAIIALPSYAFEKKTFSDIPKGYWAEKQVLSLANHGIISGGVDGRFRPTDGLRRAELAKLLTSAFMLASSSSALRFTDVPENHWASSFISTVVSRDLMKGFPDNTFRAEDTTTRSQVATILVKLKGYSIPDTNTITSTFIDVQKDHWAFPYIEVAARNNLLSGYPGGIFKPDVPITRAEAAALIYRALIGKDYLRESSTVNQITYERYRRFTDLGPLNINVLKVPKSAPVSMRLALAKDKVLGTERLSSIARRKGALAAVNADFYSTKTGECSGIMVDGQIISSPINSRSYFGFLPDKTAFIDRVSMNALVTASTGRSGIISWINKSRDSFSDTIVAYTPIYGSSTNTNDSGTEVVIKLVGGGPLMPNNAYIGTVTDILYNSGDATIPPDGIVLSGIGSGKTFLASNIKLGDTVRIDVSLQPNWQNGASAVGGGPRLVRDGEARVESEGNFSSISGRHPRTGIGIDGDGNLVIVVVDGDASFFSTGMTLSELANELKNRGAINAMNLDGGGSSALFFNGSICSNPNGGAGERAIANAILFVPN